MKEQKKNIRFIILRGRVEVHNFYNADLVPYASAEG
jgi:hypothetical protein